jgi:hypothetical protein
MHTIKNKPENKYTVVNNTSSTIMPKLQIASPYSPAEAQADAMAEHVVNTNFVQRKCAECDQEEKLQRKETSSTQGIAVDNHTSAAIENNRGVGNSLDAPTKSFMESRFNTNFSNVKIHTDNTAAQLNNNIQAKAFTTGNDIFFNEGQYNPGSESGKKLLAHELTHVVQQSNTIHRQPVNMPAQNVSVGMPSDTRLAELTGDLTNPGFTASHPQATIDLNSPVPTTVLPFTASGWNGTDIANKLGQHDRLPVTDSDAFRCVQTVALMSHIIQGPAAVKSYLGSIKLQSLFANPTITSRMRVAWQVMEHVKSLIDAKTATYGNMAQVIEAVHAMFYKDDAGTPRTEINDQVSPMLDMGATMTSMDTWCNTPSDLLTRANSLQNGEQFLLNTWQVSFNANFDLAEGGDTDIRNAPQANINILNEETGRSRNVTIRRIDATRRPDSSRIDRNRDTMGGHQMLIYKDTATGHVMMYEPELTTSGNHLFDITTDATPLTGLFSEQPAFELYSYVQLLGKITPQAPITSVFSVTP